MKLSVLIIARNEEKKIKKCLESLIFADEIIIVLDRCSDNTKKIVKKYTRKVFSGEWLSEGQRRNFGIEKCNHDWILEIDADEVVSEKLSVEIKKNISKEEFDYFYVPIINFVGKREIKFGWMACMAPDGKFSLFKKTSKLWLDGYVHPSYSMNGKKGKPLKEPILHYMSDNISDLITRFNRNTSLNSKDLKNSKTNYEKLFSVRKIFSRFFKSYISRRGYKSGKIGLLVSILCGIYPLVSSIKATSKIEEN